MLGPLPLITSVLAFPPEPENAAGNWGVVSKGENIPLRLPSPTTGSSLWCGESEREDRKGFGRDTGRVYVVKTVVMTVSEGGWTV